MKMNILDIQLSQLFLSEKKIKLLKEWMEMANVEIFPPVPIKKIGNRIFFTDGHTRAYLAYVLGWQELPVIWDEDELDWEAYLFCVKTAEERDIWTVVDLAERILSGKDY
ncbi:hypothetical protein [Streptococcus varani]|nr:hypothetical protein [Streptococcus varani]